MRVTEPGLVLHIPFVDLLVVVNLDRTIPDWRGISKANLREYVKFLALQYPQIPTNLSASDIRREISNKRGKGEPL